MRCSAREEQGSAKKGRREVGQRVGVWLAISVVSGSQRMAMANISVGAMVGGGIDQVK